MTSRRRTAILISGRGSNMAALIAAAANPAYPAEIGLVLSNRIDAPGLAAADASGIATATVPHSDHPDKPAFEAALNRQLDQAGIELICLAGFMRILSGEFVERWRDRGINIHPSLLPAFPGLDTHACALAAGVRIHGCTVHFVRVGVDNGPIIAQAAVPVLPRDTPSSLAGRVLAAEHRLYPMALALVAAGAVGVSEERVVFETALVSASPLTLFSPAIPKVE